jgi:hypothetical protein
VCTILCTRVCTPNAAITGMCPLTGKHVSLTTSPHPPCEGTITLSPFVHDEEEEEEKEGLFAAAVNEVEEKEVIAEVIAVNEVEEEEATLLMLQPTLPIRIYIRHELRIHSHGAEEEKEEEEEEKEKEEEEEED